MNMKEYMLAIFIAVVTLYFCPDIDRGLRSLDSKMYAKSKPERCLESQIKKTKDLAHKLQYDKKGKLKPSNDRIIKFERCTCEPDSIKDRKEFDYDVLFTEAFKGTSIQFKRLSKDETRFWIPGEKKKQDPCEQELTAKRHQKTVVAFRDMVQETYDNLEPGQSHERSIDTTRAQPACDKERITVLLEQCKELDIPVEETGYSDDGRLKFNISKK